MRLIALHTSGSGDPRRRECQELIEKVAFEQNIPRECIAALEDDRSPWFLAFVNGLTSQHAGAGDESIVYARVAETVRALALAGRAVIVGRDGVYPTADMEGGVHVRLVGPLAHRVENLATQMNLSLDEAVKRVGQIDDIFQTVPACSSTARLPPPSEFSRSHLPFSPRYRRASADSIIHVRS